MKNFWVDVRYGMRRLGHAPGFAFVALLTLSLAIGANTAVFSVVNGILLHPLPYQDPDALMMVWSHDTRQGIPKFEISPADYVDLQAQKNIFRDIAATQPYYSATLAGDGEPERLNGAQLSSNLIPLLGVRPLAGRSFTAEEDKPGNDQVVIISQSLWQRRYGSDPAIAGKTMKLNDKPYTIVGVLPAAFRFPRQGLDFWVPIGMTEEDIALRAVHLLHVVARLAPGVPRERAQAELNALSARLEREYPDSNTGFRFELNPLAEEEIGELRPILLVLQGAVGFILLIACANLGNLLLARAVARNREIAIRGALGATARDLLRQLLAEGVLLSLLGGALGLLVAWWGIRSFAGLVPDNLPPTLDLGKVPSFDRVQIDNTVLVFTMAISLLTGLLFAVLPLAQGLRSDLAGALRDRGAGGRGTLGRKVRNGLVVVQVMLAVLLLAGAGLLIRSFVNLFRIDPGFRTDHLLTFSLDVPRFAYPSKAEQIGFLQRALDDLAQIPGARAVSATSTLPLIGNLGGAGLTIEGRPLRPGEQMPTVAYRSVTRDYFRTLGVSVGKGRAFTAQDGQEQPEVAVINETAARRFFPGEDPIGKRIKLGPSPDDIPWVTIVGVAGDVRDLGLHAEVMPTFYQHYPQDTWRTISVILRTAADPASLVPAVRARIRGLNPNLPVYNVRTSSQILAMAVVKQRFALVLMGVFAGVALVLAAAGIYSVASHNVTQRTHEIGLRMALGADRWKTVSLILRQGMGLVIAGLVLGLLGAVAVTRLLSSLLFGVTPTDAPTLGSVLLLLFGVALLACYLPAHRATRVSPTIALRAE